MTQDHPFRAARAYTPAEWLDYRGIRMAAHFGSPADEYRAAHARAALFGRGDHGCLVVAGEDRKAWLHNLVTNAVANLDDYAGCYAFAVNVKGRILFDLNVLCQPDGLWLDVDRLSRPAMLAHFDRYLFTEDVRITDTSDSQARLGCAGPRAADLAATLGVPDLPARAALTTVPLADGGGWLVRHDFAGVLGFELIVPRADAAAWWDRLADQGARPVGFRALDALRIEAAIPWLGRDLDEEVLPPETGPGTRGLSYEKGCYLGQEIIERMRARGALARRLVRIELNDGDALSLPAPLLQGAQTVGRITSLVPHPAEPRWIGLGYVKTSMADSDHLHAGPDLRPVTIRPA